MKILGIVTLGLLGGLVGVYLAGTLIITSFASKLVVEQPTFVTEGYLSAPFDNLGRFDHGWQGEKHPLQLQPAVGIK